jgi:hypothetical protein
VTESFPQPCHHFVGITYRPPFTFFYHLKTVLLKQTSSNSMMASTCMTDHSTNVSSFLENRMMGKVQKPQLISDCYTLLSDPFRIYMCSTCFSKQILAQDLSAMLAVIERLACRARNWL